MKVLFSANKAFEILTRKKIIKTLKDMGHEVICLAQKDSNEKVLIEKYQVKFIPIHIDTRTTNPLNDINLLKTYKNIYKEISPNIILSFGIKPNIYGGIVSKKLNITSISNITGLGKVFEKRNLLAVIVENLYRKAFKNNKNFIFFQNNDDRNLFLKHKIVKESYSDILPGSGVDLEYFKADTEKINENKENIQFAFLARLLISKGIRDYINAAEIVKEKIPDTEFHVAGYTRKKDKDFINENEIRIAEEKGIIKYHCYVRNTKKFLAESTDCLVLPSYYREGVPRILLEAASMGKPLIGANSVGTKEPIQDGINGYLVEKNNAEDLAEKMIKFINLSANEKKEMSKQSRRIVEERFSDEIVLKKYINKINELDC